MVIESRIQVSLPSLQDTPKDASMRGSTSAILGLRRSCKEGKDTWLLATVVNALSADNCPSAINRFEIMFPILQTSLERE